MKRITPVLWFIMVSLSSVWWDVSPLQAQTGLEDNFTQIYALALHPNGQILAIGGRYNDEPGIWFYNMVTEQISGIPTAGNVSSLYWRPDGNAIAASVAVGEGMMQVFDTVSGTMEFEFVMGAGFRPVVWSLDGTKFMLSYGDKIQLYDGSTGDIIEAFTLPESNRRALTGIAWSETNQRLYSALDVDSELLIWDTNDGHLLPSFLLPFVSWGPQLNHAQDRLALGSNEGDGRVVILDALTGSVIIDFVNPSGGFVLLTPVWSPDDSKLAVFSFSSTNEENSIGVWDIATGQLLQHVPVQGITNSQVLVWSADGESLIFSDAQSFPVNITLPNADTSSDQTVPASNGTSADVTLGNKRTSASNAASLQ